MQLVREIRIDNPRDKETRMYRIVIEGGNTWGHSRLGDLTPGQLEALQNLTTAATYAVESFLVEVEREHS